ncbi:MAG: hypothetical protein LBQ88_07285 [Treponema sp.]|jgi:hypothetical protein|nr:hypothetical protein [Treponema sp.]
MNYLLDKLDPKKRNELLEALSDMGRNRIKEISGKRVEPEFTDLVIEPKNKKSRKGKRHDR